MAKTPTLPTLINDDNDGFSEPENGPDEFQIPDEDSNSEDDFRARMASISFDDARMEASRRAMMNPAGDYDKEGKWDFSSVKNVRVWDEDKQVGDVSPRGRTVITLWGYPQTRYDKEGNDYTPFLRFSFSPDKRMHREKEGQEDFTTKMYTHAWNTFVNIKERKPANFLEVLDFLVEEDYVLNTMNGDSGLFVLSVKAPKKRR